MDKCTQWGNSAVLWALSMSRLMVGKKNNQTYLMYGMYEIELHLFTVK